MKRMSIFRSPHFWVWVACFAGLYAFLATTMHDHFGFIEQRSFFAFTSEFFQSYTTRPGDILRYCSDFLVQLYAFPYLAAALVTALLFLIFVLTQSLTQKLWSKHLTTKGHEGITKEHEVNTLSDTPLCPFVKPFVSLRGKNIAFQFSIIPPALLTFLITSPFYTLIEVLAVIILLAAFRIHIGLKMPVWRWVFAFVGFGVLYAIAGVFSFVFVVFCLGYELCWGGERPLKQRLLWGLALVGVAVLVPWLCRNFWLYISYEQAYWNLLLHWKFDRMFPEFWRVLADDLVYVIGGYLGLLPVLAWGVQKVMAWGKGLRIKHLQCVSAMVLVLIFGGSLHQWGVSTLQNKYEKVSCLVEQEDWEAVWALCKPYFLDPNSEQNGYYVSALCEFTKLAAIMSGRLAEDYTELVPHPGFNVLFPPNQTFTGADFVNPYFGCNLYYGLGINVLSRQEAQVLRGQNGTQNGLIRRIVQCNVILNDTMDNRRYTNLLSQTPFQKNFLKNLENDTAYLQYKRRLMPSEETPEPLGGTDLVLLAFAEISPQNPYAQEFACMAHLLYLKDEGYLIERLHRFKNMGYPHLPRFFEEALIVSTNYGLDPQVTLEKLADTDFGGFHIRPETLAGAEAFFGYLHRMGQGLGSTKTFEKQFQHTYYFHKMMREFGSGASQNSF